MPLEQHPAMILDVVNTTVCIVGEVEYELIEIPGQQWAQLHPRDVRHSNFISRLTDLVPRLLRQGSLDGVVEKTGHHTRA